MTTTTIHENGSDYLQIELDCIMQKEKTFYIAKIKAIDFLQVYTVRPAQYDLEKHTGLANSFPDETDYYNHLISEDRKNIKEKDFQREANKERVSGIKSFLENEEFAFFPNTIIANCELINTWENFEIDSTDNPADFFALQNKPPYLSFLAENGHQSTLFIPKVANAILVIDGQHRLEGLKAASEDVKRNYDLIIAFIIGYDRSVIAKQFYTINYEQKAVNKSLLYQLTGEFSREINEVSFLHNVVKILNEIDDSPFYKRIKMLGLTPRTLAAPDRVLLSVSQAFLIDSMLRFIAAQAKGSSYPPIFLKYYRNASDHILIARTIARFFSAVVAIKPDWGQPEASILSKGMGVGALMKVLNLIYPLIFAEKEHDWSQMNDLKASDYLAYLHGLQAVDFSAQGPYGKSGSGGTLNKIKEDIILNLGHFGHYDNYTAFEAAKKQELLDFSRYL